VQLKVEPAPTNVLAVAAVIEIVPVPVPAVVVKLEGAELLNDNVPEFAQSNVPPLKVTFFVPTAVENLTDCVAVYPAKLSVPFISWSVVQFDALPNAQTPPIPLKVTCPPKATPLVVTVLPVVVALNVVVPVYVRVKFVA
jgi:hypothetical protein